MRIFALLGMFLVFVLHYVHHALWISSPLFQLKFSARDAASDLVRPALPPESLSFLLTHPSHPQHLIIVSCWNVSWPFWNCAAHHISMPALDCLA